MLLRSIQLLSNLLRLYIAQNLRVSASNPQTPLLDENRRSFGHIDIVEIVGDETRIAGWATAPVVYATVGGTKIESTGRTSPPDLVDTTDSQTATTGFELAIPGYATTAHICIEDEGTRPERHLFEVPKISPAIIRREKLKLTVSFIGVLISAVPSFFSWAISRTPEKKHRFISKLKIGAPRLKRPVDLTDLFSSKAPSANQNTKATIILPVYNAFELVLEALERVERNTDIDWHLIVVEDCSTDQRVRPYLRQWAADDRHISRTDLVENDENLGFIASVNKALDIALTLGNHVILLNSDALVPKNWASRLLSPILENNRTATVTPMSNDAEILSVPAICKRQPLSAGQLEAIDQIARDLSPSLTSATLPTGVGFCMALNVTYLHEVGNFDTAFGKGYGEEVDWCQRASHHGGHHIGVGNLFVEHRGGQSFGAENKNKLVRKNNLVISRRYPQYDTKVQRFIQDDPLAVARFVLGVAFADVSNAADGHTEIPIYFAHNMGGGAEIYLQNKTQSKLENGGSVIIIRSGCPGTTWQAELHTQAGVVRVPVDDLVSLKEVLKPVARRKIVYSCGVGHSDAIQIPGAILGLKRDSRDTIQVLFHDYFPISPSYTLLDSDGRFTGVPDPATNDPMHTAKRSDGSVVDLRSWQHEWGQLMQAATEITVFSEDSSNHVMAVWPNLRDKLRTRPHALPHDIKQLDPKNENAGMQTIGVLGNIGFHKGAAVLKRLGDHITKTRGGNKIVVIGNVAPEHKMPSTVHVHGSYDVHQLTQLGKKYKITSWLIPSIWPETFCFTMHEALATGLPVFCFDLGAQAEAARNSKNGYVLTSSPTDADGVLREINQVCAANFDV